jgi:hypothetical protein
MGLRAGQQAFLLDDPDGQTWVMKSLSLIVDPPLTYDQLTDLGDRLQLPSGWSYRVQTLEKGLILKPEQDIAKFVQDELRNLYDLTGPGYNNFAP